MKIGDDIFEVSSWGDHALNFITGALSPGLADLHLPMVGGYQIQYRQVSKKKHVFDVILGGDKNITISTFKHFVNVQLTHGNQEWFGAVSGLMGSYDGLMLSRNGTDLHDDIVSLGQDWQVRPEDGSFFRSIRSPQFPEKCILPTAKESTSRKLGESSVNKGAAESACASANLKGFALEMCVRDVMATGDLEMAKNMAL